ncbi:MAG: hypothetical protein KDD43_14470, partial [Bdellovibrionales bacterium]|nr:hypothetical protein [Bdellovibrionales bacterium]
MKNQQNSTKDSQEGIVKRHPDGFGFFIPDNQDLPDIYVPKRQMKGVMTNDRVVIRVVPEKFSDRLRAEVLEIKSRRS